MRFYLVAILSMGLVLLLAVGKVSTADPETSTSPERAEVKEEVKDDKGSENQPEPSEGSKSSTTTTTTKAPENGCRLAIMSTFTIIPSLVIAKLLP